MGTSIGQISLDLGINLAGFKKDLKSAEKTAKTSTGSMGSMFLGLRSTIIAAFSVRAILNFSKECINLGSNLAEVQNVVDVTFGDGAKTINAWSQTTAGSFGVAELSAKKYSGTMGAMLKSMGLTTDTARGMAMELTELTGDMASFYNLDTDTMFTKIRSGMSGEVEPLKQLGINMSVANLEAYALKQGITKSFNAMTQAEKTLLRYNYLLSVTADAQGDFARTSNSWANQTRVLQLNLDSLKATLGQAFINVLTPCLSILNELLAKLQVFANALYELSVELFGDAGGSTGGLADTTTIAANAADSLAGSTADAAESAKKYTKALAGFDKLNVLGSGDSGGSGSGGSGSAVSDLSIPNLPNAGKADGFDTNGIKNKLTEIATIVGVASLALGAVLAFTGAHIPLGIGLMVLGAGSLAAAVALDWKAMESSVATSLDLVTAVVSGGLLAVGAILALTGVNTPLGIGLMAVGAIGLATTAALNWDATTNEVKLAITGIAAALGAGLLAVGAVLAFSGVATPLGIGLMAAGAVSLGSAIALNWGSLKESVSAKVFAITAIVGGALLGLGAVLAFSGVNIPLGIALMGAGAVSLVSAIAPNWSTLSDQTKNKISFITGIAGAAMLALGIILLCCGIIPLGLGLLAAGGVSLAAAIAPNWGKITDAIKNVTNKISVIFSGLWDGIKSGCKALLNGLIGLFNGWINGLNFMLLPVRGIITAIAKAFGQNVSLGDVRIPNIPYLATGGYVKANTPQLAVIGDNKHEGEIVAPESKITEAVNAAIGPLISEIRALITAVNKGGIGSGGQTIKLYVDGRQLFEWFVKQNNSIVRQTGKSPLKV